MLVLDVSVSPFLRCCCLRAPRSCARCRRCVFGLDCCGYYCCALDICGVRACLYGNVCVCTRALTCFMNGVIVRAHASVCCDLFASEETVWCGVLWCLLCVVRCAGTIICTAYVQHITGHFSSMEKAKNSRAHTHNNSSFPKARPITRPRRA